MRLTIAAPLLAVALAGCSTAPKPRDLKIGVALAIDGEKCVVRFAEPRFKDAKIAVAYTGHAVIWEVRSNACGEKARLKENGKALGLRFVKPRAGEGAPKWFELCQTLKVVPARFDTPPSFRCDIPSTRVAPWEGADEVQYYDYEIDGDSVEPDDPGLGIKRNG